jgi:hypothetical protein
MSRRTHHRFEDADAADTGTSCGSTGRDGAGEFECVPWGGWGVAVVGIDADEPAAVEVDGFVFGGVVDGDEGVDGGWRDRGVGCAPGGDVVVAVDLTERQSAVGPSGQQFGCGVRPQRPGARDDGAVQEDAGAVYRVGTGSGESVDPAGGLGGGARAAEDGGPELCGDAGVGDEEGLVCGLDCGGDCRGAVCATSD